MAPEVPEESPKGDKEREASSPMESHREVFSSTRYQQYHDAVETSMRSVMSSLKVPVPDTPPPMTVYLVVGTLLAAIGGLLFGFDIGVTGGVIALPPFRVTMGWPGSAKNNSLGNVSTQLGIVQSIFSLGAFLGSPMAGPLLDRLGRRTTLNIGSAIFALGGALQAGAYGTASSALAMMLVGRLLAGIAIGFLSMAVPVYIAELSPPHLRGMMVSIQQLGITVGIFIAYLVNKLVNEFADPTCPVACPATQTSICPEGFPTAGEISEATRCWGWRLSLGLQCAFAIFLTTGMLFSPESPRWLAMKGRSEESLVVLKRLRNSDPHAKAELALMEAFIEEDKRLKLEEPSWWDVIKTINLRTGLGVTILQQFTGINMMLYYMPVIFAQMGLDAFTNSLIIAIVNMLSTTISLFTSDLLGRRVLMFWGAVVMFVGLIVATIISGTNTTEELATNTATAGVLVAFMCIFIIGFGGTWGPLGWVIPSEIFPLRIRGRSTGLATAGNWLSNFIIGQVSPLMLAGAFGVWGTFLFFACCQLLIMPFVVTMLPETKGLDLEDVQEKFSKPFGQFVRDNTKEPFLYSRGAVKVSGVEALEDKMEAASEDLNSLRLSKRSIAGNMEGPASYSIGQLGAAH